MSKISTHLDSNWAKGFGVWFLFDKATKWSNFSDFLNENITDYERSHIFSIFKILALATINEGLLIDKIYDEYQGFDVEKRKDIRTQIIDKIVKNQRLKGPDARTKAERLLMEQISASRQVIIPPVLQYLAGYSMGGLISFARKNFSVDSHALNKLEEFKDERNYIMHNPASSRHDIDERINQGLTLGKEAQELLSVELNSQHLLR